MLDLPLMKSPHNGFSWTDFGPGRAGGGIFLSVFPLVQFSVESGRIKVELESEILIISGLKVYSADSPLSSFNNITIVKKENIILRKKFDKIIE